MVDLNERAVAEACRIHDFPRPGASAIIRAYLAAVEEEAREKVVAITITGEQGAGKTTLADVIGVFLQDAGLDVVYEPVPDGDTLTVSLPAADRKMLQDTMRPSAKLRVCYRVTKADGGTLKLVRNEDGTHTLWNNGAAVFTTPDDGVNL